MGVTLGQCWRTAHTGSQRLYAILYAIFLELVSYPLMAVQRSQTAGQAASFHSG
jgi:hypothetical protein